MSTINSPKHATADWTDEAIELSASADYFAGQGSVHPRRRKLLTSLCVRLDTLPEGGWGETRQAWAQARDEFPGLIHDDMRRIASTARRLRGERDVFRRHRELSRAGAQARPLQAVVDSVVRLSIEAGERPNNDDHYTAVIRNAYPDLDIETARAISTVCVHRVLRGE